MGYLNLDVALKASRLALLNTALGNGAALDFYTGEPPAGPDAPPPGTLLATLTCGAPFGSTSFGLDSPEIVDGGTGYTSVPAFQLRGATGGTGASFNVVMGVDASAYRLTGGNNYSPGDLIRAPASAPFQAVFSVATIGPGGAILTSTLVDPGQFTGDLPLGALASETNGAGVNASLNVPGYSVAAVQALTPGTAYTSAGASGTALFSGGGGSGASAAPALTAVLTANAIATANAVSGGVIGMGKLRNVSGLALAVSGVGSGGTDGTYDLTATGGAGAGLQATFTVYQGAVAALQIENMGTYSAAPTLSTANCPGLTGAAIVAALGAGIIDLDVGLAGSGASVIINSTTVVAGGPVVVTNAQIAEA
jgi:hypothetical protein